MNTLLKESLMRRLYTADLAARYAHLHTPYGWTIDDVIRSGQENVDSSVGLYAGGEACYKQFSELFTAVTEAYHQHDCEQTHMSNWALSAPLVNPDPDGRYIRSTRIRIARNFAGIPFPAAISLEQRLAQEAAVKAALERELDGRYYSLHNMPKEIETLIHKQRSWLAYGDRFMESAGFNRGWPYGRGIFVHNSHKLFIWYGEEDSLRIISLAFDTDLAAVFGRLTHTIQKMAQTFTFAQDPQLGYLTSCPSNLGTTMRASFNIRLPKLHQQPDKLHNLCDQLRLQLRGTNGEHTAVQNAVYDVSNKQRLGLTEAQLVTLLNNGVHKLIEVEESL